VEVRTAEENVQYWTVTETVTSVKITLIMTRQKLVVNVITGTMEVSLL
jgi:hypothetical protein